MNKTVLLLLGIILLTSGCVYSSNTTDIGNDTLMDITKLDIPPSPCIQTEYLSNPNGTNTTCNIIPFSGSKVYYLHNESSDVIYTKVMNTTINTSSATTINNIAVPNGNTTIGNWTTGELNIRLIPGGTHLLHFHAYKTGGGAAKVVRVFFECFLTNSTGGNKTTMGVSEYSSEITTDTLFETDIFMAVPDMNTNLTDRMQINISYNVTGTGAAPDLTFTFDDLTNARFVLPAIQLDTSQFVTYNGATNDLNMGSKNITANNIYIDAYPNGSVIVGGGTSMNISMWNGTKALNDSIICQRDNKIGINLCPVSLYDLQVLGESLSTVVHAGDYNNYITVTAGKPIWNFDNCAYWIFDRTIDQIEFNILCQPVYSIDKYGNMSLNSTNTSDRLVVGKPGDGTGAWANYWNVFSSRDYKINIEPMVMPGVSLNPVKYNPRDDPTQVQYGFIAEDMPEGIRMTRNETGINLMALIALQQYKINDQENRIQSLEITVSNQVAIINRICNNQPALCW